MHFKVGLPAEALLELQNPKPLLTEPMQKLAIAGTLIGAVLFLGLFLSTGLMEVLDHWCRTCSFVDALVLLVGTMLLHEALHLIAYQGFDWTKRATFGVIPKSFMAYAYYPYVVSKKKFFFTALLPIIVLTVLPVGLALTYHAVPGFLITMAGLNATLSGGDLFIVWKTIRTVPAGKQFQSSGTSDYWGDPIH